MNQRLVHMRVEVAVGEVAAHETFLGDGGTMVAELFDVFTFGVVAEEQIHVGAGGGILQW